MCIKKRIVKEREESLGLKRRIRSKETRIRIGSHKQRKGRLNYT